MLYRSYKEFNHVTKYLGLPVYYVRCLHEQDVAWSSQYLLYVSLPERSDNLGFIEASVSFTQKTRYVIRKKGKCEIPADEVPKLKTALKLKISTAFDNLGMKPYVSPINLGSSTKCYMFAPTDPA